MTDTRVSSEKRQNRQIKAFLFTAEKNEKQETKVKKNNFCLNTVKQSEICEH